MPHRPPLVHGHRGARACLPENTIPAFRYAIRAGADAIELDLLVTAGDDLVVCHDPVLAPPIGSGPHAGAPVRSLSLAQLRQWDAGALRHPAFPAQTPIPGTPIPTLDEVFSLAPLGSFDFNLEAKSFPDRPEWAPPPEAFAALVLAQVRRFGLSSRVFFQSFDFGVLAAMRRLAPEIRLSALTESDPRDFATIAREAQAGIVAPQTGLVTAHKVQAAHRRGVQVISWTANTIREWDRLLDAGVDAIITDDPAALIAYLRALGRR